MWNSLIGGNNVLALQQTLEFTERRHNLLAGNVANMDTPDYQTRDLSIENFQRSLDEALIERPTSQRQSWTSGRSHRGKTTKRRQRGVQRRYVQGPRLDETDSLSRWK